MDFVLEMKFCAPLYQIGLLLVLSTICLFFGKVKFALLVNFVYTLYWAYVFDRAYLLEYGGARADYFSWVYFGFGFIVVVLALLGFFMTGRD